MSRLAVDDFGDHHAFFAGFVSEHGTAHAVADGVHAGFGSGAVFVHFDVAARIQGDFAACADDADGIGFAADGNEQFVHAELLFAVFVLVGDGHLAALHFGFADFGAEADVEALFFEVFLRFARELAVGHWQEVVHGFEDGDFCTGGTPDAAEFETDDACADDAEVFGHGGERQGFVGTDDVGAVHFGDGDVHRHGADGEDDGFCRLGLADAAISGGDGDGFAGEELSASLQPVDAVRFEELGDAAGELFDDVVFADNHRGHIEGGGAGADAVCGAVVLDFFVEGGAFQQGFGRDAADVQAGAAEGRSGFDAGGFVAKLGGADGGDVATGAAADDDDVVGWIHGCCP